MTTINDVWNRQAVLESVGKRLWQYLAANAAGEDIPAVVEQLWHLQRGELRRLSATHLGVSIITSNMLEAAALLLRVLPSSTEASTEELIGRVGGCVLWERTRQRRWATGDPLRFIVRLPERRYDTALGRLLRWVLEKCSGLADLAAFHEGGQIATRLQEASMRSAILLKHAKLREVRSVQSFTHPLLESLARRPHVEPLVEFARAYREAITELSVDAVKNVVSGRLLAPSDDDRLFELVVAFRLTDALVSEGFHIERLVLVPGASLPFALLSRGRQQVRVWWQRSLWEIPIGRLGPSFFHEVLDNAGLRRSSLRPDLIVEFLDKPGSMLLVEVKQTAGPRVNADRRGIVDALAYLRDAGSVIAGLSKPYSLVVGWNSAGRPATGPVMVSDQDHIEEAIRLAIGAWESVDEDLVSTIHPGE